MYSLNFIQHAKQDQQYIFNNIIAITLFNELCIFFEEKMKFTDKKILEKSQYRDF